MEEESTLIQDLIQTAEKYAKTNLELFKLKTISKSAEVGSSIILKLIVFSVVLIMLIVFSIGLALWIGDLLGKIYFGFFIVAVFYVLVTLVLHFIPNIIKSPAKHFLIVNMLNEKKNEKEIS